MRPRRPAGHLPLAAAFGVSLLAHVGVIAFVVAFQRSYRYDVPAAEQQISIDIGESSPHGPGPSKDSPMSAAESRRTPSPTLSSPVANHPPFEQESAARQQDIPDQGSAAPAEVEAPERTQDQAGISREGAAGGKGESPPGEAAGNGAWSEEDFLPQFKITDPPVVPAATVLSRISYPPLAAREGIQATVYLELYVDQEGTIRKITILKDPGYGFADAATRALLGIVCQPARVNGQPVAVRFRYPVRFSLK